MACYVHVRLPIVQEINEVVQKITGVDQPVSIWGDDAQQPPVKPPLYSVHIRLKVAIVPAPAAVSCFV